MPLIALRLPNFSNASCVPEYNCSRKVTCGILTLCRCWSVIGRSHNLKTDVSLAFYCVFSQALIIHELVHSLGKLEVIMLHFEFSVNFKFWKKKKKYSTKVYNSFSLSSFGSFGCILGSIYTYIRNCIVLQ